MTSLQNLRASRSLEDMVDYWRKRAGWYDDDQSMKEYNQGVYDNYYGIDDDNYLNEGDDTMSHSGGGAVGIGPSQSQVTFLKAAAILVALGIAILLFRAVQRRSAKNEIKERRVKESEKKRSSSRSRSKSSSSRTGSRTRSRSKGRSSGKDYELMDDQTEDRSRKSSRKSGRSRSRGRRSKSREKPSSRSKSRGKPEALV